MLVEQENEGQQNLALQTYIHKKEMQRQNEYGFKNIGVCQLFLNNYFVLLEKLTKGKPKQNEVMYFHLIFTDSLVSVIF